jgi:Tfp pilus assembly protein PilZ
MGLKLFEKTQEKRKYPRHPVEISIDYRILGENSGKTDFTRNISYGGLCFQTKSEVAPGTLLTLRFPTINPNFEVAGKVAWCSAKTGRIEVGVQFLDENDAYRARMIEEICHLKELQNKQTTNRPQ